MKFNAIALGVLISATVTANAAIIEERQSGNYASPPYYPAPKGGWLPEWSASYVKARALVSRMTLAGKVNITTSIGWSMVVIFVLIYALDLMS